MDPAKLLRAREYYDRVQGGEDKTSAALTVYGKKNVRKIEQYPEYLAVASAAAQVEKEQLKKEIEQAKRKQLRSYSKLLDKGEELMDEAKTTQEKIAAQANQRANLSTGVVSEAISWDGENRNQMDTSNIMEGIIL